MAFTRFHDDPARIRKQLEETTFIGRYMLDTPGPGTNMPFYEEPQMHLQKWGANLTTNTINLESDLIGLTRKLNRDNIEQNDYVKNAVSCTPLYSNYRVENPFVEESRASDPAWVYRSLEQNRWETPLLDPLANLEKKFQSNIQTRILEKDYYVQKTPILLGVEPSDFFFDKKIGAAVANK
jgi:hypothetical protein